MVTHKVTTGASAAPASLEKVAEFFALLVFVILRWLRVLSRLLLPPRLLVLRRLLLIPVPPSTFRKTTLFVESTTCRTGGNLSFHLRPFTKNELVAFQI